MNTYMSIIITNYGMNSKLNYGHIYITVENCQLEVSHRVDFETACHELAKLAKKLGKAPTLVANQFNPEISYRELRGYLD